MDDEEKSEPVSDSATFGPEDVVDDPDFDETAFIDDSVAVEDEPMASDNSVTDPNPTDIQEDELGGGYY